MADQWEPRDGRPGPYDPGAAPPPGPPPGPPPTAPQWGPPPGGVPPAGAAPQFEPPGPPPPGFGPPGHGWEPPPAVFQQQYVQPGDAGQRTPDGLRGLVIALTVVKAIPLVLGLVVVILFATIADDFSDLGDFGDAVGDAVIAVVLISLIFIAIGAVMLYFQTTTAMRNRLGGLAVISGIMTALDLLLFLSAVFDDDGDAGSMVVIALTLAAQGAVFAWALSLRSGSRT